jgi:hypothetical protein
MCTAERKEAHRILAEVKHGEDVGPAGKVAGVAEARRCLATVYVATSDSYMHPAR